MREFRFLDEKRKVSGLSEVEEQRWSELRQLLGLPDPAPVAADPSQTAYADPNAQQYPQGYYGADGNWYPYPADYYAGGFDPNQAWDPNAGWQQQGYPQQPGYGYDPNQPWQGYPQQGWDPNQAQQWDPNQQYAYGYDPAQYPQQWDPNQPYGYGYDPAQYPQQPDGQLPQAWQPPAHESLDLGDDLHIPALSDVPATEPIPAQPVAPEASPLADDGNPIADLNFDAAFRPQPDEAEPVASDAEVMEVSSDDVMLVDAGSETPSPEPDAAVAANGDTASGAAEAAPVEAYDRVATSDLVTEPEPPAPVDSWDRVSTDDLVTEQDESAPETSVVEGPASAQAEPSVPAIDADAGVEATARVQADAASEPIAEPATEPEQEIAAASELSAEPTSEPVNETTAEPVSMHAPEQSVGAALDPATAPAPEPIIEAALEQVGTSVPEPVIEAASEPAETPAPEAVIEAAPEPAVTPVPEPVIDAAPEQVAAPAPEPVIDAAPGQVAMPAPEPVIEAAPEPAATSVPEPVVQPAPELVAMPAPEPVIEAAPEPAAAPAPEPTIEAAPEPAAAPAPEPVIEAAPEPAAAPAPEPTIEAAPEPVAMPSPAPAIHAAPEPVVAPPPAPIIEAAAPEPVAISAAEPITEAAPVPAAVPTPEVLVDAADSVPLVSDVIADDTPILEATPEAEESTPVLDAAAVSSGPELHPQVTAAPVDEFGGSADDAVPLASHAEFLSYDAPRAQALSDSAGEGLEVQTGTLAQLTNEVPVESAGIDVDLSGDAGEAVPLATNAEFIGSPELNATGEQGAWGAQHSSPAPGTWDPEATQQQWATAPQQPAWDPNQGWQSWDAGAALQQAAQAAATPPLPPQVQTPPQDDWSFPPPPPAAATAPPPEIEVDLVEAEIAAEDEHPIDLTEEIPVADVHDVPPPPPPAHAPALNARAATPVAVPVAGPGAIATARAGGPIPRVASQLDEPPRAPVPPAAPARPAAPAAPAPVLAPASPDDLFDRNVKDLGGSIVLSPSFVDGEHRVIVHTVEGQVKRGVIRDTDLFDATIPLEQQTGFAPERIPSDRVKAVFFMLPPGNRPPAASGRKIRVTFTDGRQVTGFSEDFTGNEPGFFVIPADNRTNTARIFIYRASVHSVVDG